MEYISDSPQQTQELGAALAEKLEAGAVVAFTGDLGAGKTAFTRGLAQGLGISERVTSPTFTIVNEYGGGRLPLKSCLTSAGRTIWTGAECAWWSGARTLPTRWRRTPCAWTSAGGPTTGSGSLP